MKKLTHIAGLLLLTLLLTAIAATAGAEKDGLWEYSVETSGLTITGYAGKTETNVVIPAEIKGFKVTGIAAHALADHKEIEKLTIPEGIVKIGPEAFKGCVKLNEICFNAVDCSVPEVNIFSNDKGAGVFSGAGSSSVTGLKVIFGDSVKKVPDHLFETASLDDGAHKGHPYAYVTEVVFSGSVKEIGWRAFCHCANLEKITVDGKIKTIDGEAFRYCSGMTDAIIGDSVTFIGDYAFDGCTAMETLTLGSELDSIGDGAFSNCSSLKEADLPVPLATMGKYAFADCISLKKVTIPSSLSKMGAEAFRGCVKLNEICFNAVDCSVPEVNIFSNDKGAGVFSGAGSSSVTGLKVIFGDSVKKVPDHLFETASLDDGNHKGHPYAYVTEVVFSGSIKEIGWRAFCHCANLEKITVDGKIKTIDGEAFRYCTGMTDAIIGDSVTFIGDYAFDGCNSMETLTLGSGLDSIGTYAFAGCASLTEVDFPVPLTALGVGAFVDCISLKKITLPTSLAKLGGEAFKGCVKLNEIYFNAVDCAVPEVYIYNKDKGAGVFSGAGSSSVTGLKIIFGEGVKKVPDHLFETASINKDYPYAYVTEADISSTVTSIGSKAFSNCKNLTSVSIRSKTARFADDSLEYCDKDALYFTVLPGSECIRHLSLNSFHYERVDSFEAEEPAEEVPVVEEAVEAVETVETVEEAVDEVTEPLLSIDELLEDVLPAEEPAVTDETHLFYLP